VLELIVVGVGDVFTAGHVENRPAAPTYR
jgi:hypothetical protein